MKKGVSDPERIVKYVEDNFGKTITFHYVNNLKQSCQTYVFPIDPCFSKLREF